jgi:hypothetical protein
VFVHWSSDDSVLVLMTEYRRWPHVQTGVPNIHRTIQAALARVTSKSILKRNI